MHGSAKFQLVDLKVGGDLVGKLREWRGASRTFEEIARDLSAEAGVEVIASTVWRWVRDLDTKAS